LDEYLSGHADMDPMNEAHDPRQNPSASGHDGAGGAVPGGAAGHGAQTPDTEPVWYQSPAAPFGAAAPADRTAGVDATAPVETPSPVFDAAPPSGGETPPGTATAPRRGP